MSLVNIPQNRKHKPIIAVDYTPIDEKAGAGDAEFISIGKAQWNNEDISAKVFRVRSDGGGSRQSEELPLWRVLDLATLIISRLTGQESSLNESIVSQEDVSLLDDFLKDNMQLYLPRIREIRSLLNSYAASNVALDTTPNIFDFATSELSQDAILCYLFKWADDKYLTVDEALCLTAKVLLSKFSDIPANEIHQVSVGRQWKNIDIWVEINEDAFLIVEDKTSTTIHDNQLERYKKIVEEEYKGRRNRLAFTYYKSDNEPQSILKSINDIGYKTLTRCDILDILRPYRGNALIENYVQYIDSIEKSTQEFLSQPVEQWGWYQWQGFFKRLEQDIEVESWDYVPNPNGGFLGLWWHFREKQNDEIRMYLQFEEQKLCVKIEYWGDKDSRSEIREKYHSVLMEGAHKMGLAMNRPSRFGCGTYMTIGVVPPDEIFGNGQLQIEELISKLHEYEKLVDACVN